MTGTRLTLLLSLIISTLFIASCGSGSGSGAGGGGVEDESGNEDTEVIQFLDLSNIPIAYDGLPAQNKETSVSLFTTEDVGEVNWLVESEPAASNLILNKSLDNKMVTFTANAPGDYKIVARSINNASEKSTNFSIIPNFPFDQSKIEGNDGSVEIEKITGPIINQSWINSTTLTEIDLELLIADYIDLQVIGYDSTLGLLVEYDESDVLVIQALEEIKLENGVDSVRNRYYRGKYSIQINAIFPDDDSAFDDDGGDNWHLEYIGAPDAWDKTTGSGEVVIGISEGAYDIPHFDFDNSGIKKIIPGKLQDFESWDDFVRSKAHGNATAGTVSADTGNGIGMSGINWLSPVSLGSWNRIGLENILSDNKVVVVNNSWGFHIPEDFNPDSIIDSNKLRLKSIYRFLDFRDLVKKYPNKLFVWAAGNGIGNGKGNNNEIYGVDAIYDNGAIHYHSIIASMPDELNNVIVVAAMRKDNALAFYSNYGESVDIAAPTSFKSLSSSNGFMNDVVNNYGDGLSGYTGTSAAAPVVTGIASLVYSLYPGFTGEEVKSILINTKTNDVTERYIAKDSQNPQPLANFNAPPIPILNGAKALEKAQQILDNKVNLQAVPGDSTALISWENVSGAIGYHVYWASESGVTKSNYSDLKNSSAMSTESNQLTISGLTNDTTYYFVITVINAIGESSGISEISVTPTSTIVLPPVPSTPPTGTSPGTTASPGSTTNGTTVNLSWSSVIDATYYEVEVHDLDTGALVVSIPASGTSYSANLVTSKQYSWKVAACNSAGCSDFTAPLYFQTPSIVTTPEISSLSFTSVPADSTERTLIIYGSNFTDGNVVKYRWLNPVGGNSASTLVSSDSQLSVSFNPGDVEDTIYVKVCKSSTITDCSNELSITVTASIPTTPAVSSVSPDTITQGTNFQNVTIYGSNFTQSSYHQYSVSGGSSWAWATSAPTINDATSMTIAVNNTVVQTVLYRVCASNGSNNCSESVAVTIQPEPAPTLSFSSLTPATISTEIVGYQPTVSATGNNFNNVNQVTFSLTGATSGTYTWNRGDSNWNANVTVNSDTSMALRPVVTQAGDPSGTTVWNVTMADTTGATASQSFSVTYGAIGPFDGDYGLSATSTTQVDMNGSPCTDALGILNIVDSELSGYVIDGWQDSYDISGNVQANGVVTGGFASGGMNTATFEGSISGSVVSGTWVDIVQCAGNWQAIKN